MAERIGTEHHEVVIAMDDFFNALPRLIWHEDEPISWPSSVSLYFVPELAAEHVKVVLTGEGSDELFAGYARYRFYQLQSALAERLSRRAQAAFAPAIRDAGCHSPLLLGLAAPQAADTPSWAATTDIESLYLDNFYCAFAAAEQQQLLARSCSENPLRDSSCITGKRCKRSPTLSRLLYADQKTYLVELLMKQDQMSMACSIESRVPFLDHVVRGVRRLACRRT